MARYSATLFRRPLASPISRMLIQLTVEEIASQIPYLLVSNSFSEKEIVRNETIMLTARNKKETTMLKLTLPVRPEPCSNKEFIFFFIIDHACCFLINSISVQSIWI